LAKRISGVVAFHPNAKLFDVELTNVKTGKKYGVYVDTDGTISQFSGKTGLKIGTDNYIEKFNINKNTLPTNEEVKEMFGIEDTTLSINSFVKDEPIITKEDIDQLGKQQEGKVLEDLLPVGKTMKDLVEELKKKCK